MSKSLVELCGAKLPDNMSKVFKICNNVDHFLDMLEVFPKNKVSLEGRFSLGYTLLNYHASQGVSERYANLYLCMPPTFSLDGDWYKLRWDSVEEPEFWLELTFPRRHPKNCILSGRGVPYSHTLTGFQKDKKYISWRFDDVNNLSFWCQITLENE